MGVNSNRVSMAKKSTFLPKLTSSIIGIMKSSNIVVHDTGSQMMGCNVKYGHETTEAIAKWLRKTVLDKTKNIQSQFTCRSLDRINIGDMEKMREVIFNIYIKLRFSGLCSHPAPWEETNNLSTSFFRNSQRIC